MLRFEKPEDGRVSLCDLATHLIDRTAPAPLEADMRTLPLRHADYDRIDTFIFDGLSSRAVDLVHRETGRGVRLSFDMPVLAVLDHAGQKRPLRLPEPWQGMPAYADETGRFEDKPYHISLGVGQAFTCGYRMRVL